MEIICERWRCSNKREELIFPPRKAEKSPVKGDKWILLERGRNELSEIRGEMNILLER
jgi:hypothetical protein